MNLPNEQVIAAIIAIAAFAGYVIRFFMVLFAEHVTKQTDTLVALVQEGRAHDKINAQAHRDMCEALKEERDSNIALQSMIIKLLQSQDDRIKVGEG